MKIDLLVTFSVTKEEIVSESIDKIQNILIEGEEINLVYSHVRDKVWFTNKRIIAMDVQGLTGSKKEYRSFPYSNISSFSVETAGTFDGDSDFKIWVSGVGVFEIKFRKKLDIRKVGRFLSERLLSN
jgi:effector-binding domain-containing protein